MGSETERLAADERIFCYSNIPIYLLSYISSFLPLPYPTLPYPLSLTPFTTWNDVSFALFCTLFNSLPSMSAISVTKKNSDDDDDNDEDEAPYDKTYKAEKDIGGRNSATKVHPASCHLLPCSALSYITKKFTLLSHHMRRIKLPLASSLRKSLYFENYFVNARYPLSTQTLYSALNKSQFTIWQHF